MTRDEAIDKAARSISVSREYAREMVNMLEALGLLNLDKPRTPEEVLRDAFPKDGYVWAPGIADVIASAGLRVVPA